VKVGVLTALKTELAPTLKELKAESRRVAGAAYYEAGPYYFRITGVGAERARQAAVAMCENFTPAALVSTGFCGSLSDEVGIGRLLVGDSVSFRYDERLFRLARAVARDGAVGHVLSVENVLLDARSKRELRQRTGAIGIDMEAAAVGETARQYGVGFLCVKAVLDTPAAPLASDYGSVPGVLADILRRPSTVRGIARDAARAKECAARLRDFFLHFGFVLTNL
jgi:nucleoside phosphorylase